MLALAERIRSACVEQMGRLGEEVVALRAGLPRVPEREERILAGLPVPTEQLPTPGKQVCLRQALAFEPPTAEVAYAVDLVGKCWAGR